MKVIHICFPSTSERQGEMIDRIYLIIDMKGCGVSKMMESAFMKLAKMVTGIASNNFPELMIRTYFINVPRMFSIVWSIVKWWLDEKTRDKICIIGKDYKKSLLKDFDEDQLPVAIGGTCQKSLLEGRDDMPW